MLFKHFETKMRIIDPKLRSISAEYEKKEKDYLLQLEEIQKWEKNK